MPRVCLYTYVFFLCRFTSLPWFTVTFPYFSITFPRKLRAKPSQNRLRHRLPGDWSLRLHRSRRTFLGRDCSPAGCSAAWWQKPQRSPAAMDIKWRVEPQVKLDEYRIWKHMNAMISHDMSTSRWSRCIKMHQDVSATNASLECSHKESCRKDTACKPVWHSQARIRRSICRLYGPGYLSTVARHGDGGERLCSFLVWCDLLRWNPEKLLRPWETTNGLNLSRKIEIRC